MNTDYAPNSHKSKEAKANEEKPKQEKVIAGTAKRKKKSEVSKLASSVFAEDAANVWSYITQEVLIPSFKKAISDIVSNGVDMFLYGEPRGRSSSSTTSRVSYRNYYDKSNTSSGATKVSRSTYDFDEVEVETYAQADRILERMDVQIRDFGSVSVADMYEYAGLQPSWTDNKYGWTTIAGAKPERTREGRYVLKMPKSMPL